MPETTAATKRWYKSKTLYFNMGLAAATIFLDAVPDTYAWVPVANLLLRYFTTTGLSS